MAISASAMKPVGQSGLYPYLKKIEYPIRKLKMYFIPNVVKVMDRLDVFKQHPISHAIGSITIEEVHSVSASLEKIAAAIVDKEVAIEKGREHTIVILNVKATANKEEFEIEYVVDGETNVLEMAVYKDYELKFLHQQKMLSDVVTISDKEELATIHRIIQARKLMPTIEKLNLSDIDFVIKKQGALFRYLRDFLFDYSVREFWAKKSNKPVDKIPKESSVKFKKWYSNVTDCPSDFGEFATILFTDVGATVYETIQCALPKAVLYAQTQYKPKSLLDRVGSLNPLNEFFGIVSKINLKDETSFLSAQSDLDAWKAKYITPIAKSEPIKPVAPAKVEPPVKNEGIINSAADKYLQALPEVDQAPYVRVPAPIIPEVEKKSDEVKSAPIERENSVVNLCSTTADEIVEVLKRIAKEVKFETTWSWIGGKKVRFFEMKETISKNLPDHLANMVEHLQAAAYNADKLKSVHDEVRIALYGTKTPALGVIPVKPWKRYDSTQHFYLLLNNLLESYHNNNDSDSGKHFASLRSFLDLSSPQKSGSRDCKVDTPRSSLWRG